MTDSDVINECRQYVAANEAAAEEYLSRYFVIAEHSLRELKATMLSEFLYVPLEDVEKIPSISYSKTTQLPPVMPSQSPEEVVHLSWLSIPERLSNLRCYRLTPRMSVTIPSDKPVRELSENLKSEVYTMSVLPVFHLSSFLALLHRRFPLTENCIREYERNKSLKELQQLAAVNSKVITRASAQ